MSLTKEELKCRQDSFEAINDQKAFEERIKGGRRGETDKASFKKIRNWWNREHELR